MKNRLKVAVALGTVLSTGALLAIAPAWAASRLSGPSFVGGVTERAPGVGSTITIAAVPGLSPQFAVTVLQVFPNYYWSRQMVQALQGTRPVSIKIRVTDTGVIPLSIDTNADTGRFGGTPNGLWAIGDNTISLIDNGQSFPPIVNVIPGKHGCYPWGFLTPNQLMPGEAAVSCIAFAYGESRSLSGAKLWWTSGSDGGVVIGTGYHWVLVGPPWAK